MSYSIASWELSIKTRQDFRVTTRDFMIERAKYLKLILDREYVILDLTAKDVGLKLWRTPPQSPSEVTTWINYQVPSDQIFAVYKVIQLSKKPKVTTLNFTRGLSGSATVAVQQIEKIYALLPVLDKIREYKAKHAIQQIFGSVDQMVMEAYFTEPIIFDLGSYFQVRVTSPEGNKSGDRLMLGGFALSRLGSTIT